MLSYIAIEFFLHAGFRRSGQNVSGEVTFSLWGKSRTPILHFIDDIQWGGAICVPCHLGHGLHRGVDVGGGQRADHVGCGASVRGQVYWMGAVERF